MPAFLSELNKLKSLVGDDVWEIFKESRAIIAGGCLTSIFSNKEVNDIDVYLRSEEDFETFLTLVYASNFNIRAANKTDRSILFRAGKQDVQLIIYKWFDSPQQLFDSYDFTINMAAVDCVDESFHFHEEFFKHLAQRYLAVNVKTDYPLISALRVQKYIDRGYYISKAQMLRLLLTISALELDSWDKIKDHIGGMYGMDISAVLPTKEEFKLDKAIDALEAAMQPRPYKSQPYDMQHLMTLVKSEVKREDCSERLFKMVLKDSEGILRSFYNTKFIYGDVVDGGTSGIYFCKGTSVVGNQYWREECAVVIELELGDGGRIENKYGSTVLMGPVKVVNQYSRMQFVKQFGIDKKKKGLTPPAF